MILVAIWCATAVGAHERAPGHACVAPDRPIDDQNDALWQQFLEQIDAYRECVSATKDAHEAAVVAHQQAARLVVEDWNSFVRTSLNAPEDFPWPPQAPGKSPHSR